METETVYFVMDRSGERIGRVTSTTPCSLEGCGGLRYRVSWTYPDGTKTRSCPCSKGMSPTGLPGLLRIGTAREWRRDRFAGAPEDLRERLVVLAFSAGSELLVDTCTGEIIASISHWMPPLKVVDLNSSDVDDCFGPCDADDADAVELFLAGYDSGTREFDRDAALRKLCERRCRMLMLDAGEIMKCPHGGKLVWRREHEMTGFCHAGSYPLVSLPPREHYPRSEYPDLWKVMNWSS